MNSAGWIFLAVAWSSILTLVTFCYRKVLASPGSTFEHPERTEGPGSAPGA